jgi:tRNA 2-selenouridine synthase
VQRDGGAQVVSGFEAPTLEAARFVARSDVRVVDLRAPVEFERDHWPGAVNVPLFDDAQRAVVGALYRQVSPDAAFEAGRAAIREHVGPFVRALSEHARRAAPQADFEAAVDELTRGGIAGLQSALAPRRVELASGALVMYCQRGGLRSRATAALLARLGFDALALVEGGYKGWRRILTERIAAWTAPPTLVLRGLTGVGKTLVLRELERLRPGSTLDLEELAQHRSSVLGMVGLAPVTQKHFETRLALRLEHLERRALVVEGESRKVGDVIVPSSVWSAIHGGANVELVAPMERRVEVLLDDYLADPSSREQLAPQLEFLGERLRRGGFAGSLIELLNSGRERELVQVLLERYYDPLYRHSELGRKHLARIDAREPRAAAEHVAQLLDELREGSPGGSLGSSPDARAAPPA